MSSNNKSIPEASLDSWTSTPNGCRSAYDSWRSTLHNSIFSDNAGAPLTASDNWVTILVTEKAHTTRNSQLSPYTRYNCPNEASPAAVSKPIDIPGRRAPQYMCCLPQSYPFGDHKVHCYRDNVTDYCRRDKNDGWEFMRRKRRESTELQVGKVLAGSWELVVSEGAQSLKRKDPDFAISQQYSGEIDEIERYLNGETDLLGYLKYAREEMRDQGEEEDC